MIWVQRWKQRVERAAGCLPLDTSARPPFVPTAPALLESHTHKRPFCGFSKPPHTMKAPPVGLCTPDAFHFCAKCMCNLQLFQQAFKTAIVLEDFREAPSRWPIWLNRTSKSIQSGEGMMHLFHETTTPPSLGDNLIMHDARLCLYNNSLNPEMSLYSSFKMVLVQVIIWLLSYVQAKVVLILLSWTNHELARTVLKDRKCYNKELNKESHITLWYLK